MIPFELSTGESALVRGGFFRRSRENKGKTNMKQLKFMLAAATAIGLATAAQAARFSGSTDFEGNFDLATEFTYSGTAGDNESAIIPGVPTDVERPANHGFTAEQANMLQVNTGTEPIVRSVDGTTDGVALGSGAVYIDTLVQFTVTPSTDDPTPAEENGVIKDKLMVYLKEFSTKNAEGNDVLTTNLCVKGGYCASAGAPTPKEYTLTVGDGIQVEPNKWYRLTVTAYGNVAATGSYPAFSIKLDNDVCYLNEVTFDATNTGPLFLNPTYLSALSGKTIVLSMVQDTSLKAVGFAGEGKVDDLVISTFDPTKTVVDFTLTLAGEVAEGLSSDATYSSTAAGTVILNSGANDCVRYSDENVTIAYTLAEGYKAEWSEGGSASFAPTAGTTYTLTVSKNAPTPVDFTFVKGEGVSAIKWTIAGGSQSEQWTGKGEAGTTITIDYVGYSDWYVAPATGLKEGDTVTVAKDAQFAINAKKVDSNNAFEAPEGGSAPTATQVAESLKITNDAFKGTDAAAQTALKKGLAWATKIGAVPSALNEVTFESDGDPDGTAAEAYLLDCAPTQDAIDAAMEDFELKGFSINNEGVMTFGVGAKMVANEGEYANGHVEIRGKEKLSDTTWSKECAKPSFFKAFLVK